MIGVDWGDCFGVVLCFGCLNFLICLLVSAWPLLHALLRLQDWKSSRSFLFENIPFHHFYESQY